MKNARRISMFLVAVFVLSLFCGTVSAARNPWSAPSYLNGDKSYPEFYAEGSDRYYINMRSIDIYDKRETYDASTYYITVECLIATPNLPNPIIYDMDCKIEYTKQGSEYYCKRKKGWVKIIKGDYNDRFDEGAFEMLNAYLSI